MALKIKSGIDAPVPVTGEQVIQIKTDLGLEQVDNTPDSVKPISSAVQAAINARVPNTRMVGGVALSANVDLKTVGGTAITGVGDIPLGVGSFSSLTDKTTADLPTVNTPLAAALTAKVPTTRTIGGSTLATDITLKTIGGLSIVGSGDIALGAGSFSGLTDKTTVDLPSVNTPLGSALATKVPTTRTVGGSALSSDVVLKTVGGVSLVGAGDIALGAGSFSGLSDKTTVDLPAVNTPLSTALGTLTSATNTAQTTATSAQTTANAKPNLQAGTLSLSTVEAASPTATINYVGTIVGTAATNLNTLGKLATAINNDPAFTTTVNASIATVNSAAATAQATADGAVTALSGKLDKFTSVDLGTGASFSLTIADNANRANKWRGAGSATITLGTTGAVDGDYYEVANDGSGTISFNGVSAATGYKTTSTAGEVFQALFSNGTLLSATPSNSGGGGTSVLATVAPTTGSVGTLLTCTVASGWTAPLKWIWADTGADISPGQTGTTYTIAAGDVSHSVACKVGSASAPAFYFVTNSVSVSSTVPGQPTSFLFGTATDTSLAYSFTAPGSGGAPTSYNVEFRTPPTSGTYGSWGGHSGLTTTGTITGLTAGLSYEGRVTAVNLAGSGTPSAANTKSTTSSKITFSDDFAGALNARWSDLAGWATGWASNSGGGGKLTFSGADWGSLVATTSAGNNTFAIDLDTNTENHSYAGLYIALVDSSNFVRAWRDEGLGAWTINTYVGGVAVNTTNDPLGALRGGSGGNASRVQLAIAWTSGTAATVTFTSTGGLNPGNFSANLTGIGALAGATKCGMIQNFGKPLVLWDNASLS